MFGVQMKCKDDTFPTNGPRAALCQSPPPFCNLRLGCVRWQPWGVAGTRWAKKEGHMHMVTFLFIYPRLELAGHICAADTLAAWPTPTLGWGVGGLYWTGQTTLPGRAHIPSSTGCQLTTQETGLQWRQSRAQGVGAGKDDVPQGAANRSMLRAYPHSGLWARQATTSITLEPVSGYL